MPYDLRSRPALTALAAPLGAHQSALATTVDEVRGLLESQRSTADRSEVLRAEMGALGAQHIDMSRLTSFVVDDPPVQSDVGERLNLAIATLNDLAGRGDDRFIVSSPTNRDLRDSVGDALADVGRAFGAARVAALSRNGAYRPSEHDAYVTRFPFGRWSAAERKMAPPLIVEVDGEDLVVGGLHAFLDGLMKIVLVVRGEAPPAPLVRLITPGVLVAQCTDDDILRRLAEYEGPGIVALMPPSAAQFVHDPAEGDDLAGRLTVMEMPDQEPRTSVGALSAAQQIEDLKQLKAMVERRPAATGVATPTETPADPVDKLAAWLLQQADLTGVE